MRSLAILGSTGSIGRNCLEVAERLIDFPIRVRALAANENIDLLEEQARQFRPEFVAVFHEKKAKELQLRMPEIEVIPGMEGLLAVATCESADLVISSMSGAIGLTPTLAAIRAKKRIGFANKEVLVAGGGFIMSEVKKYGVDFIPIDSELTALFQCLKGEERKNVARLLITASGGPFRFHTEEALQKVTLEEALNHPNYRMGPKVTIDSSTLMNKGLEMIEAHWLFGINPEKIEVVVHPEQVIHGMVEFEDNSMLAQMGFPHMIPPIQYAITYPDRSPGKLPPFDFAKYSTLRFFVPDTQKFRCLALAREALVQGDSYTCFMNGANETLVNHFLEGKIGWHQIATFLEKAMNSHLPKKIDSLEAIFEVDRQARQITTSLI